MRAIASRPLFWFILPWLIILLVPPLRLMAGLHFLGSEYSSEDAMTPIVWFREALPPTAQELARRFPAHNTAPEIWLKAPTKRGDWSLPPAELKRHLDAALKRNPRDAWLLSLRLRRAMQDVPHSDIFVPLPFNWPDYDYDNPDYRTNTFPLAGKGSSNDYEDDSFYLPPPSLATKTLVLPKVPRQKIDAALGASRRGSAVEPDNGFWHWQIAYLLMLARRNDEAAQAVIAASNCSRFDSHQRDDIRAALNVARLHRPLSWQEELTIASRQIAKDSASPQREQVLLWLAQQREKDGNPNLSAAIARVAARMLAGAVSRHEQHQALLLQSAAWMGSTRPVLLKTQGGLQVIAPNLLPALMGREGNSHLSHLTPLSFSQEFAIYARRLGRADLATEALRLGHDSTQLSRHWYSHWEKERFGVTPASLARAVALNFCSEMTLLQIQFTGFIWLALSLVLWRRMAWAGRLIARIWFALGLIWRVRDKPLQDEVPVASEHTPRDLRRSFWFCGALVILSSGGMVWWDGGVNRWLSGLAAIPRYGQDALSVVGFNVGPILGGILWIGGAALWRYSRLKAPVVRRDDAETVALHIPPSAIPIIVAFMVWSVTAVPLFLWLLWLLTRLFGPAFLNFNLPPLWAQWLGQPSLDWSVMDVGLQIFFSFVALGVWLLRWCWQLHPRRRLPALAFGAHWLRAHCGIWLILGSWLYVVMLIIALPAAHDVSRQISTNFRLSPRAESDLRQR